MCECVYTDVCVCVYSDYKGWSCLHHAASEGFTQTMERLLVSDIKLLDKTDTDGVGSNPILFIMARSMWTPL